MKSSRFIILSIILSLALHLLLFQLSERLHIDARVADSLRDAAADNSIDTVLPLNLTQPPEPEPVPPPEPSLAAPESSALADTFSPEAPAALPAPETAAVAELLKAAELREIPVEVYEIAGIEGALSPALPSADPIDAIPEVTAPHPELLEIKSDSLSPERLAIPGRLEAPALVRAPVPSDIQLPSLAAEGPLAGSYAPSSIQPLELRAERIKFGGLPSADLVPNLPPATAHDPGSIPFPAGAGAGGLGTSPSAAQLNAAQPLDAFVEVTVTVRRDAAGTGGCFQVDIMPTQKSDVLQDIPKDVLFIIDRSASISGPKFQQFKLSVQEALPGLSSRDRFNVISFNDSPRPLFTGFATATTKNLRQASQAVGEIPHGGMTDVFGGIAPYVRQSNGNPRRPLNIFLLTDGLSTVNIYEPNVFLKSIASMNPGNVSIFPCSADDRANRQLLDFLGYLNRGSKCHADRLEELRPMMVSFIAKYSSIIAMDLKCQVISGAPGRELFPKSLPHLYRNAPLRLFGRFNDITDELVLDIIAKDADGNSRDLVFRRKLLDCPTGDELLPQRWAGQKLLYLLARKNTSTNNAERQQLTHQINELSRIYGIYSKYDY